MGHTDEVDTGKLLKRLQQATCHQTLAQSTFETFGVSRLSEAHLVQVVGLHFVQFLQHSRVVGWQAAQLRESLRGLVIFVGFDEVAWRLWKENETGS
jgi:hypothetical protein